MDVLVGLCSFSLMVACVTILRLSSDVKLWRDSERDLNSLWKFERDRANWLKKELEDERRRKQDGPYR